MVQQTLGWFGAYPEKQSAFSDLAEAIDTAFVSKIAKKKKKQPVTPTSISIARGLNHET